MGFLLKVACHGLFDKNLRKLVCPVAVHISVDQRIDSTVIQNCNESSLHETNPNFNALDLCAPQQQRSPWHVSKCQRDINKESCPMCCHALGTVCTNSQLSPSENYTQESHIQLKPISINRRLKQWDTNYWLCSIVYIWGLIANRYILNNNYSLLYVRLRIYFSTNSMQKKHKKKKRQNICYHLWHPVDHLQIL